LESVFWLRRALQEAPSSTHLANRLLGLCQTTPVIATEIRLAVNDTLRSNKTLVPLSFVAGSLAVQDGNTVEAQRHLRIAMRNQDFAPAVLNNLAWAIANDPTGEENRKVPSIWCHPSCERKGMENGDFHQF